MISDAECYKSANNLPSVVGGKRALREDNDRDNKTPPRSKSQLHNASDR
jgi:hypothetical protein